MDSTLFESYLNKSDINETNKNLKRLMEKHTLHRGQRWFSLSLLTIYSHLKSTGRISSVLGRCPQSQIKPGLFPLQFLFEKRRRLGLRSGRPSPRLEVEGRSSARPCCSYPGSPSCWEASGAQKVIAAEEEAPQTPGVMAHLSCPLQSLAGNMHVAGGRQEGWEPL